VYDHYYTRGDTGPILQDRLLTPSLQDYDLTGHEVQFTAELLDDPSVTVSQAGTVDETEVTGKRPFANLIPAGVFPAAGIWLYRWKATIQGVTYSFPNDGEPWTVLVSEPPGA